MTEKHDKVVSKKKVGEKWYTVNAPEELRYWHSGNPWPYDAFREYGVALIMVEPHAKKTLSVADTLLYSKMKPLKLKSGTTIIGGYTTITSQSLTGRYPLKPKGMAELTSDMVELTVKHQDISSFRINRVTVYNFVSGYRLYFEYFNPNKTGDVLALWAIENEEDGMVNFSQIPDKTTLDKAVGAFREVLLGCVGKLEKTEKMVGDCTVISAEEEKRIEAEEKRLAKEKIVKAKGPTSTRKAVKPASRVKLRKRASG